MGWRASAKYFLVGVFALQLGVVVIVSRWQLGLKSDRCSARTADDLGRDVDLEQVIRANLLHWDMAMQTGIPSYAQLEVAMISSHFASMKGFSDGFLSRNQHSLGSYIQYWVRDPLMTATRPWEYMMVFNYVKALGSSLLEQKQGDGRGMLDVLDAGSGVTFFPFYLMNQVPEARVTCVDYDNLWMPIFDKLNEMEGAAALDGRTVTFINASLTNLPMFAAESFDIVYCISVLEHLEARAVVMDEFFRVLRPGGYLVLTFDISLDGKGEILIPDGDQMFRDLDVRFEQVPMFNPPTGSLTDQLGSVGGPLLSTREIFLRKPPGVVLPWATLERNLTVSINVAKKSIVPRDFRRAVWPPSKKPSAPAPPPAKPTAPAPPPARPTAPAPPPANPGTPGPQAEHEILPSRL